MTDPAQRTAWAIDQFQSFVNSYTPPAMQVHCREAIAHVKRVIRAIAPSSDAPLVGYAVFGQKPDREYESGFEHIAVSVVTDHLGQAQNAYDYCVSKGEVAGCKYFVICAVQQIP